MKVGMEPINFSINTDKAFQAILYVIAKAGGRINTYNLLKVIFEADKYHLNTYARPVTGDRYRKMKHGTVPSMIFDFVKVNPIARNVGQLPLRRLGHDLISGAQPNMDFFSESDIEAIDYGFEKYGKLSFDKVQDLNHKEKCWLTGKMNRWIDFDEMIDNDEIKKYLLEHPFKIAI